MNILNINFLKCKLNDVSFRTYQTSHRNYQTKTLIRAKLPLWQSKADLRELKTNAKTLLGIIHVLWLARSNHSSTVRQEGKR